MKNNQNTVGVWSRQTGKSTAVSAFVVWKLLFGKGVVINGIAQPETIIVAAPAFDQTKLLFNKIKSFILNNELIFKLLREDMKRKMIKIK
jgi:phage terminase large subunit-like protein